MVAGERSSRTSPASALLLAYLDDQLQALTKQSRGVRGTSPTRCTRCASRSVGCARSSGHTGSSSNPTSPPTCAVSCNGWPAPQGQARDAQVLHERLTHLLDDQPADLVVGPVRQRIDEELQGDFEAGRAALTFALESDRFVRLVDALDDVLADPPLTPQATKPANKTLPRLLDKTGRRLHRAVEAATGTEGPDEIPLSTRCASAPSSCGTRPRWPYPSARSGQCGCQRQRMTCSASSAPTMTAQSPATCCSGWPPRRIDEPRAT